jgi:hypothetical protein
MAKIKRTLDIKKPDKLPPFMMAEPNDDAAAFGWSLDKLRYPSKDSTKGDVWPGNPVFQIEESNELRNMYGFDIDFVNAKFVQVMLDNSEKVRAAAEKCATAKYSEESRANLRRVIMAEFKDVILPEMLVRFKKVSGLVADFYAARLAHLMTYGPDED